MKAAALLDWILRTLSRRRLESLHRLGRIVVLPIARLAYRRRVVLENLARTFPDADAGVLADRFYTALVEVYMEVLRSRSLAASELAERVTIEGAEALRDGGAVLLMAHHGNLVWAVTALAGEIDAPVAVVYKPPHVAILHRLLLRIAERFGVSAVPVKEMRRQIVRRQQNRVWTLVADQRPGRHRHHVQLCGRATAFHLGPQRVARALNRPVYYLSCRRVAPGRYRCKIERIAEPPYGKGTAEVVERYVAKLQADIDHAPEDWLWSHNRWRPPLSRLARLLLVLALIPGVASASPRQVIFETDMTFDVDDVGALAVLHALADLGEVALLAVTYNEVHPRAVAAIRAINAWYGRPDVPVGVYSGTLAAPDASRYLEHLVPFAPRQPSRAAPAALDVYRTVLGRQPDASVTIVSVGFLNNLDDLLREEPRLVANKVRELVVMGGRHDDAFNFVRHALVEVSARVLADWPTPLAITDFGYEVRTGETLAAAPPDNPVREAYYRWFGRTFQGRPSWDQVAVLYGVRGVGDYFRLEATGDASLRNGFRMALAPGWRSYVLPARPAEDFKRLIEGLMTAPPASRP